MSVLILRLPDSLYQAARELAQENGMSIDHLVTTALAEKISTVRTVEYFRERAAQADEGDWKRILAAVPDVEPEAYDRF